MDVGDFTSGNLRKQVIGIALPMSVGMFFNTMFNVADTYFVGNWELNHWRGCPCPFLYFLSCSLYRLGWGLEYRH